MAAMVAGPALVKTIRPVVSKIVEPVKTVVANAATTVKNAVGSFFSKIGAGLKALAADETGGVRFQTDDFVNLASPERAKHILYGDKTGGGHLWPGADGKSAFPKTWSADQTMHSVSDIATDPGIPWIPGRTVGGVQRYSAIGVRDGCTVKVVTDGRDIITAYPVKR